MKNITLEDIKEKAIDVINQLSQIQSKLNSSKLKAMTSLLNKPRVRLECADANNPLHFTVLYKKLEQIMEAESSEDIKNILMQPKIYYNGAKIVTSNRWVLPEEELIMWSNASLQAPLSQEGMDRYMEVFKTVYPEDYKKVFEKH